MKPLKPKHYLAILPRRLLPFIALTSLAITSSSAFAGVDEAAAKALLKRNDCTKCHHATKTKKGPAYKKVAEKYKGKADAEKKMVEQMTKGAMVKLEDGTEEEHKIIDTKDPKELKNLVNWILAQ